MKLFKRKNVSPRGSNDSGSLGDSIVSPRDQSSSPVRGWSLMARGKDESFASTRQYSGSSIASRRLFPKCDVLLPEECGKNLTSNLECSLDSSIASNNQTDTDVEAQKKASDNMDSPGTTTRRPPLQPKAAGSQKSVVENSIPSIKSFSSIPVLPSQSLHRSSAPTAENTDESTTEASSLVEQDKDPPSPVETPKLEAASSVPLLSLPPKMVVVKSVRLLSPVCHSLLSSPREPPAVELSPSAVEPIKNVEGDPTDATPAEEITLVERQHTGSIISPRITLTPLPVLRKEESSVSPTSSTTTEPTPSCSLNHLIPSPTASTSTSLHSSNSSPQSCVSVSSIVEEIASKARLRRMVTNVVDQEFTTISRKHNIPAPSAVEVSQEFKIVEESIKDTGRHRQSSGSIDLSCSKQLIKRMSTSSVACPGFGSIGAEKELRRALTLRKLKTVDKEVGFTSNQ